MLDLLFRKLRRFTVLSEADRKVFEAYSWKAEWHGARTDLIQEGNHPRFVNVVLEGWACRYKQLEDGRRQILALFLPGDMCDPCVFLLDRMSHTLATLTPAVIARLPEPEMLEVMRGSEALSRALWLEMLISAEVQREWTVSLGRRSALERMAHLFCEILFRLRAVGRADMGECDMPITQADLGDALGLSSVHVNRTLQELRAMGVIELRGKRLVVRDETSLRSLAQFSPDYLHQQRPPS